MAIHESSGNVFEDLGFDKVEAANMSLRSFLMRKLSGWIKSNEFTQKQAAGELGVTQSRVSDLVTGKIHNFTVDNLLSLVSVIGYELIPKETRTRSSLDFVSTFTEVMVSAGKSRRTPKKSMLKRTA
jgi:predicted XRE-type DNA-binding protein